MKTSSPLSANDGRGGEDDCASQSRRRRTELDAIRRVLAENAAAEANPRDLHRRSLMLPVLQTVFNLALYAGLGWAAASSAWGFLLWPAMGLLLAGFLAAAHDCLHNSYLDTATANRIAGAAWCTPILVDYTLYKYPHLAHHRYTRVPGDTEEWVMPKSVGDYLRAMFFNNPFGGVVKSVRAAAGRFPAYIDSAGKRQAALDDGRIVALWLLVMVALTLVFPRVLAAVYWGPFVCFSSMLRLSALPEHWGCGEGPEVCRSTRSVVSNPLIRTVLWNGNFHVEHHLYPSIPSCNLSELSRRLRGQPIHRARSYVGFHLGLLRRLYAGLPPLNDPLGSGKLP